MRQFLRNFVTSQLQLILVELIVIQDKYLQLVVLGERLAGKFVLSKLNKATGCRLSDFHVMKLQNAELITQTKKIQFSHILSIAVRI